jgi:hypothetical protein
VGTVTSRMGKYLEVPCPHPPPSFLNLTVGESTPGFSDRFFYVRRGAPLSICYPQPDLSTSDRTTTTRSMGSGTSLSQLVCSARKASRLPLSYPIQRMIAAPKLKAGLFMRGTPDYGSGVCPNASLTPPSWSRPCAHASGMQYSIDKDYSC